jgi:DNA-binding NtrC family response regulator
MKLRRAMFVAACLCLVTHAKPGAWIDVEDIRRLQPDVLAGPRNPSPEAGLEGNDDVSYGEAFRSFKRRLILDRLRRSGGSAADAAASLQISGPTFYRYWSDARRVR